MGEGRRTYALLGVLGALGVDFAGVLSGPAFVGENDSRILTVGLNAIGCLLWLAVRLMVV